MHAFYTALQHQVDWRDPADQALVEHAKTREKKEAERRSIANLRDDMRARLAPFDGGLVRLSNSLD